MELLRYVFPTGLSSLEITFTPISYKVNVCVSYQARQSLIVRGLFPMLADPRHPVSLVIFLLLYITTSSQFEKQTVSTLVSFPRLVS